MALEPTPTAEFDAAYEALLQPGDASHGRRQYVDDLNASARTSYLVERIYGVDLDAPKTVDGQCVGEPPLTGDERVTIVRWIELGATYRGTAP